MGLLRFPYEVQRELTVGAFTSSPSAITARSTSVARCFTPLEGNVGGRFGILFTTREAASGLRYGRRSTPGGGAAARITALSGVPPPPRRSGGPCCDRSVSRSRGGSHAGHAGVPADGMQMSKAGGLGGLGLPSHGADGHTGGQRVGNDTPCGPWHRRSMRNSSKAAVEHPSLGTARARGARQAPGGGSRTPQTRGTRSQRIARKRSRSGWATFPHARTRSRGMGVGAGPHAASSAEPPRQSRTEPPRAVDGSGDPAIVRASTQVGVG